MSITPVKSTNGTKKAPAAPTEKPEASAAETKPPYDKATVRAQFQKVFDFQESIREREDALKEERKQVTGLLKAILDATNDFHGPFVIKGVSYTIVSRKLKDSNETTYHLRSPQERDAVEL